MARIRCIFLFLLYIASINLPFFVACRLLSLWPNGYFSFDYLVVALFALFLSRLAAFSLVFLVTIADIVHSICTTYAFSLNDLVESARYLHELSAYRLGMIPLTIVVIILTSWLESYLLTKLIKEGDHAVFFVTLFAFLSLCISIDLVNGRLPKLGVDFRHGTFRMVRFPIAALASRETDAIRIRRLAIIGKNAPLLGATSLTFRRFSFSQQADIRKSPVNDDLPNVVLVVVESWGKIHDQLLEEDLIQPYEQPDIRRKYDVVRGDVIFSGATIGAETRELCNSKIGFGIIHRADVMSHVCLPAKMSEYGYQTTAIHGFSGYMFQRNIWYPKLGFEEVWFQNRLKKEGLGTCPGAFVGICDTDISGWIGKRLQLSTHEPQFLYWVTLNSHLPLQSPNYLKSRVSCSLNSLLMDQPALCAWFQILSSVHQSIYRAAIQPLKRPTVFIIVGDHAPPFSDTSLRNLFSEDMVPYVVLIPKENADCIDWKGNLTFFRKLGDSHLP